MSRNVLGLDIRNNSITAVLVKKSFQGNWIEAQKQVLISGRQEMETGIITCLNTINETNVLAGSVCIAALPAHQFAFRSVDVPFKENRKIRQILPYELEPTLPFAIENLIIDFYVTHSEAPTSLVAAAIKKTRLASCLSSLSKFNLETKIITAGGYSTARCLSHLRKIPKNCLFMDLDNTRGMLCLVVSGRIDFIRTFLIHPNSKVLTESLSTETNRTMSAFSDISKTDFHPESIIVSDSGLHNSIDYNNLSQALELPVETPDLINTVDISIAESVTLSNPKQRGNALALALIELEGFNALNFRKGPFDNETYRTTYKKEIAKAGVLVGLILALMLLSAIVETRSLINKIDHLDIQIMKIFKTSFPEIKKIVDPVQQMGTKIKSAQKQIAYPIGGDFHIRRIDIFNDISKLIPKHIDVEFTRLVIGPRNVLISGNTNTFNSVNIIKGRLERGPLFQKVTINSANMNKPDNRIRFKLQILLSSTFD